MLFYANIITFNLWKLFIYTIKKDLPMNWFTISLILGIVFVIIGIITLIMGVSVGAIVALAIGAGFLSLDFKPASSIKDEFSGLQTIELIKKLVGIIVLLVALILFINEIQQHLGIF